MKLSKPLTSCSRKLLTKRLDEALSLQEAAESEIRTLKNEKSNTAASVVDLTGAIRVLRAFEKGFDGRPVSEQREILSDVMKRILVHPTRIVCEIYGQKNEEEIPFTTNEGLPEEISGGPFLLDRYRTRVRPGNRLVELKYQQTNRSTNTISLSFLLAHPHEFTKNVLHFTRVGSRFAILKSEQEFLKQLFVKL